MRRSKVGVCVVGCGRAGVIHARNFAAGRIPGAELAALVDPAEETREAAARELGVKSALADSREALQSERISAVVIATPTAQHLEVALRAAEAGKHILCEKPMAMDEAECLEMIRAAEAAGVHLQIGFMRRFDPGFVEAKARIDAGEIGQVVLVKSTTHGPSKPRPWMYDLEKSNGPLAEVNSHDIDTLRWFTESEFEEVYAIAGNFRSPEARPEFPDFYDNVLLSARFRSGAQGSISGAQGVRYGYDARCEVLGTEGVLFVGRLEDRPVTWCNTAGMARQVVRSWGQLFLEAYEAEDRDFIRSILEDRPPRVTGSDGLEAVRVVNAGNRSIREGRPIRLDSGRD